MNLARLTRARALRSTVNERKPRIALYSHDAQGLGHVRRNLSLAKALLALDADILLLTGAPEAIGTKRIEGIDVVAVPALSKSTDGEYQARSLGLGLDATVRVRSEVLRAAVESFAPDLLIVDKHPRGFRGEMLGALNAAKRAGSRVVLGLRDVLDEASVAKAEWRAQRNDAALKSFYDEVWLYGDRSVYDASAELNLRIPVRATGYLATGRVPEAEAVRRPRGLPNEPYVLCVLGGGSDGAALADAFARATYPAGHNGVLITGPHLPQQERREIRALAAARPDLIVHTYRDDLEHWYGEAAGVVAMGGYNTVCEVLAARRPFLVVPRVTPRAEQLVRAQALAERGALELCHPADLRTDSLRAWFESLDGPRVPWPPIDLDGLAAVPTLAAQLIGLQEVATSA